MEKVQFEKDDNKNVFEKILFFLVPKANPDFEEKINLVSVWLFEFDNENVIPNREIGLNSKNEVILKMPNKRNYGYWVDNDLTYNDFTERFNYMIIDREVFENKWTEID